MNLVQRVQDMLLKPKETWPTIEAEPGDVQSIYKSYVIFLAAIPAVCGFIGQSIIGTHFGMFGFGVSYREPLLLGLVRMVLVYALSLVMIYVMSLIVNALAPTFKGSKHPLNAFKLIAFSMTAGYVGGVFSIIPMLGFFGLLAGGYSIYLLYLGLPTMMKNPPDQSAGYTVVIILCGIVAGVIASIPVSIVTMGMTWMLGIGGMAGGSGSGNLSLKTPQGEVTIDSDKINEMAKRMEAAGKKMEAAQKSEDPNAAGKAAAEMLGALAGGKGGAPIPAQDLKALLPESIGDMKRNAQEATSTGAVGISVSSAKAEYGNADNSRHINLSIADTGGFAGLMSVASWASLTVDKETNDSIEKVYKSGKRTVREEYRKDNSHSEYMTILENGVLVEARGEKVEIGELKRAVEGLDLGKLEAMQRPAKTS